MRDYLKFEEYKNGNKCYLNENNEPHRLTGAAVEYKCGDAKYCINGICYIKYDKDYNKLYIYPEILKLISDYEICIKQNIKDLIQEYNSKIELAYFYKEKISQLPDWIKDLVIV